MAKETAKAAKPKTTNADNALETIVSGQIDEIVAIPTIPSPDVEEGTEVSIEKKSG